MTKYLLHIYSESKYICCMYVHIKIWNDFSFLFNSVPGRYGSTNVFC